ncbi:hypothetical protein ACFYO1_02380 [Nocardia sp. NPDC006044]|uniref:hypothetical protein n=1 Tax=Nocardia sp. NPDC006044 TaxID=3364306 RepID=UPI0036B6DA4F
MAAKTASAGASNRTAPKHYASVDLVPPKGASIGLVHFIGMADAAIQDAVDLLGHGVPTPPPEVADLLQPVVYRNLGQSEATEEYQKTISAIDARQGALLTMDRQVVTTSNVIAAEQNQTLGSIMQDVDALNAAFRNAEPPLQSASNRQARVAIEVPLMDTIAHTIQRVYARVTAVYQLNTQLAGNSNSGTPQNTTAGQQPAAGGGGPDLLSSLLPMVAMLPMAAIPLMSLLPELLKKPEDKHGKDDKKAPGDPATAASDNSAPPADPGALPADQEPPPATANAVPANPDAAPPAPPIDPGAKPADPPAKPADSAKSTDPKSPAPPPLARPITAPTVRRRQITDPARTADVAGETDATATDESEPQEV